MSTDIAVTSVTAQSDVRQLILIADDSRVVRVSLRNILLPDYDIIEAEDGAQAWNTLIDRADVRLIFSDLAMPNLDGLALLKKIRQSDNPQLRDIPFIVVTGKEDDQQIRNQLLHEGANDLITKPFVNHEITERAKRHIKKTSKDTQASAAQEEEEFLTGITNKTAFTQNVKKELSFAIRNKNELALLLLKLDQFDTIKKHYSDPAIEHILITTAEIIRAHTHIEDKIAYFGDGTFAILLPASNAIGTRYLGKRILADLLAKKFYLGESDTTVTASIGVSAPDIKPGITFSEILHLAEQRLQAALNAGGQRVVDKGNATITPVSTLLADEAEEDSTRQRLLRQTEMEMRKLASKEVEKIKAHRQLDQECDSQLTNAQEINDALLLAEHENRLIKEELVRLRLQVQDIDQLKQRLHESDSLLQQAQLTLSKLRDEHEQMKIRAELAESLQPRAEEPDPDSLIVEQHLLQENEQLQRELNVAKQRSEETLKAYRKSEKLITNLKLQLKKQKEAADLALAEEHTKHAITAQRLADLEARQAGMKHAQQVARQAVFHAGDSSTKQQAAASTYTSSPRATHTPAPQPSRAGIKTNTCAQPHPRADGGRHHRSRLLIAVASLFLIISVIIGYRYWQGSSPSPAVNQEQSRLGMNQAQRHMLPHGSSTDPLASTGDEGMQRHLAEEAKLQAELTLRQTAEEEFQLLLQK